MKPALFFTAIIIFLFSCHDSKTDIKAIKGTYVRVQDTELNVLYDTASFSPVNDEADDVFLVIQSSSTHFKKIEEQGFNKKAKHTIAGTYDYEKHILQTTDPGIVYAFDLKAGVVTINAIRYQKIQ